MLDFLPFTPAQNRVKLDDGSDALAQFVASLHSLQLKEEISFSELERELYWLSQLLEQTERNYRVKLLSERILGFLQIR
jgi:hypothetical protein